MAEASRPSAAAEIPIPARTARSTFSIARGLVVPSDPDEAGGIGRPSARDERRTWIGHTPRMGRVAGRRRARRPQPVASDAVREAIAERQQERAAEEERVRTIAREQADRNAICEEIEGLTGAAEQTGSPSSRSVGQPPADAVGVCCALTRRFQDASDVRGRERRPCCGGCDSKAGTLATELEQLSAFKLPLTMSSRGGGLRAMPMSFATTPRRIRTRRSAWSAPLPF